MKQIVLFSLLFSSTVYAGELQMIHQLSNMNGTAFGSNYTKQNYYSYLELGLSKKSSIGGSVNSASIDSAYNGVTKQYAIFGPEVFHRYKFFAHGKHGFVLQNGVKFPNAYDENKHLGLMPKQWDYEIRVLGLYNFKERLVSSIVHDSTPYFARYELAYRKRFNNPFDEVRFAFVGGFDVGYNLKILVQDNINWNINSTGTSVLNSTYSNFDITKDANNIVTISLFYHINNKVALQAGYAQRLSGNNPFYDKHGITIGVWSVL